MLTLTLWEGRISWGNCASSPPALGSSSWETGEHASKSVCPRSCKYWNSGEFWRGHRDTTLYKHGSTTNKNEEKLFINSSFYGIVYLFWFNRVLKHFLTKMSSGATTKQKVITLHPEYANVNTLKHYFQKIFKKHFFVSH